MHTIKKIISGGQTGADIGGLVGAKRLGIPTGGTAPKGYKTEVGDKPNELKAFGLKPHPSANYRHRTEENIKNSQATIIMATDIESVGTQLTVEFCEKLGKPYVVVNPFQDCIAAIQAFIREHQPETLNIAGNRESKSKGIAAKTAHCLQVALSTIL